MSGGAAVPADSHDGGEQTTPDGYPTDLNRMFWIGVLVGWAVIVAGVRGLLVNASSAMPTEPTNWVTLFVKLALLNDLVILPIVFMIGVATTRFVPGRIRPIIQGGLICTAIVVVFAYPFVRRFGASPGNPTILPRNYTLGLIEVVAVVLLGTAVLAVLRWRRTSGASDEPARDIER